MAHPPRPLLYVYPSLHFGAPLLEVMLHRRGVRQWFSYHESRMATQTPEDETRELPAWALLILSAIVIVVLVVAVFGVFLLLLQTDPAPGLSN